MLIDSPSNFGLKTISEKLAKERDGIIRARKESKLEEIWQKAREQYQGIDDKNKVGGGKATTLDGPVLTSMGSRGEEDRSTVFVNITRPYTNAGTARVADILLPTGGKRNWDLKPTPVSDVALLAAILQEYPGLQQALPEPMQARLAQTEDEREAAIKIARKIIEDWLTETKWHSETRNQITEAGKVGTGVLKGPFAKKRKVNPELEQFIAFVPSVVQDPIEAKLLQDQLKTRLLYQPAVECIPVENCYPDMPSCGNDIQNGRFFWEEVPSVSRSTLQEDLADETYFASQIQACLEEGPQPNKAKGETVDKKKKSFTRWRRTGELDITELLTDEEKSSRVVWVELELINDRIVKISAPPLDTKRFPYNILLWEARQDSWAGIGIAEQIETPQRGLNASVRAGNDNMGWSVGFQLILGKGLEALDGNPTSIHAYKIWRDATESLAAITGTERNPKDALATIEFPNHLEKILPWINFWLQMAESTTGLSLLMQGQKATDSVGVSQMLMNSSTTNLRMFVKHWDDDNCSPIIQGFYEWVQLYGPDAAKSDAVAAALGSSTLITRELQQQALIQLLDRTVQPVYGKSPKKTMDMFLESMQFEPRQLDLDAEEQQQLEAASKEPDPKVTVEQLRSDTDKFIAGLKDNTDRLKIMLDAQMKGESLEQAAESVATQVEGNIALEAVKQDGEREKEELNPPKEPAPPEGEPTTEQAMNILGLSE